MVRALIGVSASLHDFGNYGGVGIQRPLLAAGALPVSSLQLPEADTLAPLAGVVARARTRHRPGTLRPEGRRTAGGN